jgi:hypothetical protein
MSVVIVPYVANTDLPRILWDKITGTVTGSTAAALYDAAFANTPQTYLQWKPTAVPATWEIAPASPVNVDSCAIGCHTLGSSGSTLLVQYTTDGSTWITVTTVVPTDDTAILVLFPLNETATAWRIQVTNAVALVGVVMFGVSMVVPIASIFAPQRPITQSEKLSYNVNITDGGNWAGRTLVAKGLEFSFSVQNISESFAEGEFALFRTHANEGNATFFIAPKPASYPKEVAYAWSSDVVVAERVKPNLAISRDITLSCTGYRAI